jgi:F-type H+-transporting ATPase subunit delta
MANETLARRYATAIFSLAKDRGSVDRVGDDLSHAAQALSEDALVHDFFVAPVIQREAKSQAILRAFEGRVDEIVLHSLLLLVRKRREALLGEIAAAYSSLRMAAHGAEPLTVTSARQLGDQELHALVAKLEELYRKKFEVAQVVDPRLIGGVRITMGDRRIDGTIAGRLDNLARELFART